MPKVRKQRRSVKRNRRTARREKAVYRVKNWSAYNEALKQRGDIPIWLSPEALAAWHYTGPRKRGGKIEYSDVAIEACLTLRLLYHLGLRETEGFVGSLLQLMGLALPVPDYSTLSRRQPGLVIDLGVRPAAESVHLVIDSSGLKLYGDGEWLVRQHGWRKHRRWINVHLGVEAQAGTIVACTVTTNSTSDADQVPDVLSQVPAPIATLGADSQYDKWKVYEHCADPPGQEQPIEPIISPRTDAKITQHGNTKQAPLPRDQAIRAIRKHGRKAWKHDSGYHRRSLAETAFSRYKRLLDDHVKSRGLASQLTETRLGCQLLNRMDTLGKPDSYKVVKAA